MPLNDQKLLDDIFNVLNENQKPEGEGTPQEQITNSINSLAEGLRDAIKSYVSNAEVIDVKVDPNSGIQIPPFGKLQ